MITNFGSVTNPRVLETGGHSCPHYLYGTFTGDGLPIYFILSQTFVVPRGFSHADVSAWVQSTREPGDADSTAFFLEVDEVACGNVPAKGDNEWVQVRCPRVPLSEGSHVLSIFVTSLVSYGAEASIGMDDLVARAVE
jgi:hypothetical protein